MASGEAAVTITAPADQVWKHISDFGGLDQWMPGVDSCDLEGDVRKLSAFGMDISEKLVKCDDGERVLEYSIIESPLNADSHLGRVSVYEDGDGSRVTWFVEVEPDILLEILVPSYQGALDALKSHVEG